MQFIVYALYSLAHDRIYIGQTSDLVNRFTQHNNGESKSTKAYLPWKLMYSEIIPTRAEAMKHEKQLKSQKGREFIRNLIKDEANKPTE